MAMYWDPFREIDRLAESMRDATQGPRVMPIDLHRDGDHYVLAADLPGVDPGSVDVDVDGQLLTIRAERTLRSESGTEWLVRERPSGSFQRRITLGDGLDTTQISAHYDNGVLSVIIPISEMAKPRKIAVTSTPHADKQVTAK
ncbi:Hsp20/alpha crystallin family protein [Agromyces endophyticus]|uniref:Hsp20/alpha crystallin family protein n=1 Tax=Agromyces sp. H17E-10 TaxID=2932244 RepID=UPI001FD374FF|nr:Hsp20/alpha crystallin family protein [Agromyces sp. H17E-10]UOQ88029.1 Hsp20/alpha crystallin family protein [Agromyces sp. H17E-10]